MDRFFKTCLSPASDDIAVDRQLRTFANPKRAAVTAIHSRLVLTIMAAAIIIIRPQLFERIYDF
ncbi:MAG: hypothetical protein ACYTX0_37480, partial [Nostoc sp.]